MLSLASISLHDRLICSLVKQEELELAGELTEFHLKSSQNLRNCFPRVFRTIFTILGVSGFVASKNSIDKKRYESMKIRDRIRKSNEGEYQIEGTKKFDL